MCYPVARKSPPQEVNHDRDVAEKFFQAVLEKRRVIGDRLVQGDLALARECIEPVADWILAGNAQRFWDPWIICHSAYRILTDLTATDRGRTILDEAHNLLQQRAKAISEPRLRDHFLNKVAINRDIAEAWQPAQNQV